MFFYYKPHIFKDYTTFSKEKAMTSLFCVNTITNPQTLKGKSLLMDIIPYLLSLIQFLYQQNCWLINFICRYIPLRQWVFDDSHSPKYQKFKIDEPPPLSLTSVRTGLIKSLSLTTKNAMAGKYAPSAIVPSATSLTTAPAHAAMPRNHSFTKTMAPKVRSSARSVLRGFLLQKAASPVLSCAVPTAAMHLSQRKTESTLSSINA